MPQVRVQSEKPSIRVVTMGNAPIREGRSEEEADKDFEKFLKAYNPCKGKDCD